MKRPRYPLSASQWFCMLAFLGGIASSIHHADYLRAFGWFCLGALAYDFFQFRNRDLFAELEGQIHRASRKQLIALQEQLHDVQQKVKLLQRPPVSQQQPLADINGEPV